MNKMTVLCYVILLHDTMYNNIGRQCQFFTGNGVNKSIAAVTEKLTLMIKRKYASTRFALISFYKPVYRICLVHKIVETLLNLILQLTMSHKRLWI